MPLVSVAVQDYQSYRDKQVVGLDEHLTLIAGRNDVGKSALLRLLRLFVEHQEGAGDGFEMTLTWRIDPAFIQRYAEGQNAFAASVAQRTALMAITYRRNSSGSGLSGDTLQAVVIDLPEVPARLEGGVGSFPGWTLGPGELVSAQSSVGHEIFTRAGLDLAKNIAFIGPRNILTGIRMLTADPALSPDGSNLADVLHTQYARRDGVFSAIEDFMRSAFPEVERIAVRLSEGGSPLNGETVIHYRHSATAVPLQHTGSGMAQLLALATGVLTNTTGRLFLIDEPQAYLHPRAEHDLLSLLEEHPEHQYVIATHSNFLLNARPLSSARLLRIEDGATRVLDATKDELLSELGITAADLWLAAQILWVEGATEVGVFGLLVDELPANQRAGVRVAEMPVAKSFFTRGGKQIDLAFRFIREVLDATRETPVKMRFLFDRDESRSAEDEGRLLEASGGLGELLSRRELENYFLDSEVIHRALAALCEEYGLAVPALEVVKAKLDELIADVESDDLYSGGLEADADPLDQVRGSSVLEALWSELAQAQYDKPKQGEALARLALEMKPELLEPLRVVLRRLLET